MDDTRNKNDYKQSHAKSRLLYPQAAENYPYKIFLIVSWARPYCFVSAWMETPSL